MSATFSTPSLSHEPITRSLGSHLRALQAVARREWLIFVRYPSWVVQMFIWPIIFPLMFIFTGRALGGPDASGLQQFMQVSGASEFNGYVIIGTTIWMWQNVVLWNVGFALRQEQWRGTLESNWMAPTWRFAYLLGTSFPQMASMAIFLVITALESGLLFGVRIHGSPWLILLVLAACIPAIYGMGFAFASIVVSAKEANTFVFLVRGLVMIFCGISFPISLLPGWMQGVAAWLPQTYMIHAMRLAALSNASLSQLLPDLRLLLGFGLFWLAAGYFLFLWMERRARRTGAISQY
jgi:ABC-2 type transport system permease protein